MPHLAGIRDAADTVVDGLRTAWDGLTSFVEYLVEKFGELSALEIALLVIGTLLIARGVTDAMRLRSKKPGPVEIADFFDGGGDTKTERLVDLIRGRLADIGVLPPSVPITAATAGPVALVKEAPLPQAKWVATVLEHAPGLILSKRGHRVTGGAWSENGGVSLSIAISDLRSGEVERIVALGGKDYDDAARRAAAAIYQEIMSHGRVQSTIPGWERWRGKDGEALALLQQAFDLERADSGDARESYDRAVEEDPFNGILRLRRASAIEESVAACGGRSPTAFADLLDAVEDYRETSVLWPQYWQARYRQAVLYSFASLWNTAWSHVPDPKKADARSRFRRLISATFTNDDADLPKKALFDNAFATWTTLDSGDTASAVPAAMQPVVKVGRFCTDLQWHLASNDLASAKVTVADVRKLAVQNGDPGWELDYNLACFYSLATTEPFNRKHRRAHAFAAIRHLDPVGRSPSADIDRAWFRADPDLENLRQWLARADLRKTDVPPTAWFWRGMLSAPAL